jgi:hypothetical protein
MNRRFMLSGLVTSAANLILHAVVYFLFLKEFYASHPAGSQEFVKQLHRGPGELVGWAMAVTSLAMGFLITTMIKWSGATTFISGLRKGFVLGFLFWASVNFALYASSNYFSTESVFVDYVCSSAVMTVAAAVSAWMLGKGGAHEVEARVR